MLAAFPTTATLASPPRVRLCYLLSNTPSHRMSREAKVDLEKNHFLYQPPTVTFRRRCVRRSHGTRHAHVWCSVTSARTHDGFDNVGQLCVRLITSASPFNRRICSTPCANPCVHVCSMRTAAVVELLHVYKFIITYEFIHNAPMRDQRRPAGLRDEVDSALLLANAHRYCETL